MKYIILFFGLIAISQASSFSGRIINSIPSAVDDGYAVTVYSGYNPFPDQSYLSTGIAITEQYILASGQAIYDFEAWRVGINSVSRTLQEITEVVDSFLHEEFDPQTLEFNIGVLKVGVAINQYIRVSTEESTFPVLFTIGFGYISDGVLPIASQQSAIHILDNEVCRLEFNQRVVRDSNLCVNTVAPLASGDQGAPAVDFLRTHVYGMVSFWNPANLTTHNPAVFTKFTDPTVRAFLNHFLF